MIAMYETDDIYRTGCFVHFAFCPFYSFFNPKAMKIYFYYP